MTTATQKARIVRPVMEYPTEWTLYDAETEDDEQEVPQDEEYVSTADEIREPY